MQNIKLITEQFQRFLLKESTKEIMYHNFKQLFSKEKSVGDMGFFGKKQAFKIVSEIPVLQNNKITHKLGSGVFGTAYKLDNGHVIKIYRASYGDVEKYATYLERTFSGADGSQEDLAVFDMGRFDVLRGKDEPEPDPTAFGVYAHDSEDDSEDDRLRRALDEEDEEWVEPLNWVELPEIMPIDVWFNRTGRGEYVYDPDDNDNELNREVDGVLRNLLDVAHFGGEINQVRQLRWLRDHPDIISYLRPFTKQEALGIIKAIKHHKKFIGSVQDFHDGQLGVYPHNPSIWVIFDS